ncbi:co-chaperone GroES [Candidatus Peregrinibacteria bacterium]|nr:co-chaperone GroES [Candidatus Peregrinibacteria bacterium]
MSQKTDSAGQKIHPLGNRLVVEALEDESKTVSGIVIPDTASKEKPQKGKVMAVGPGKLSDDGKRLPMSVKEGDTILFTKYGPTEVKIDGKEILILDESDVLAVLE